MPTSKACSPPGKRRARREISQNPIAFATNWPPPEYCSRTRRAAQLNGGAPERRASSAAADRVTRSGAPRRQYSHRETDHRRDPDDLPGIVADVSVRALADLDSLAAQLRCRVGHRTLGGLQ